MRFSLFAAVALVSCLTPPLRAQDLRLPNQPGSLKFAVIGDTGTASKAQNEVGAQMEAFRQKFPYTFVLMVGDNLYGSQKPGDFVSKFEAPYAALLKAGIKFYAAFGNHDEPGERNYKLFNMAGKRYYAFEEKPADQGAAPEGGVRFYALDSVYMDKAQLDWVEKELGGDKSGWKICYFHHPLYSSARTHGSSLDLRAALEPLFEKYGVDVVFTGHDHVYERTKPQKGITYFVTGAGGSLRKGDLRRADFTAAGFDQDFHFMLVEIAGGEMHYQAISRTGATVDSGDIPARAAAAHAK